MITARSLEDLNKFRDENGYLAVRPLEDGSIAGLLPLIFTWAICLGIDEYGFHSRYCFENRALAYQRFWELKSEDDVPDGYTSKRAK